MKKQFDIKKLVLLNLPYLLMGLFATNFGEAWRLAQGANASEKFLSLFAVLPGALQSFWPSLHPLDLLVGLCCGAGLRLAVYLKSKNAKKYRHGMEYGSARWGTREDIAPYIDPVFQNNVILTKTESLTMNSRPKDPKTARNKNVLVIGGSGSGKTRFWLKPNLMQMHSSYVVTDPKGTILVECGKMLQRGAPKLGKDGKPMKDKHGKVIYEPYRIKVLNTINFKKSMHYNPFAYIHSEKDILKLVTTLIANTKGEGKAGDDFWVKAETLLYCALIGYIHYEAPVEEQNFSTLIEFINAMEVREDDEEFKNPVDLMFDALEAEKPNHFAVRQYKKYKLAAGKASIRIPFFERLDKLNLRLIPIDVKTSNAVPTADYININVDATVNVKISNDPEKLRLAAENFLNKNTEYIASVAREVLEGNVREIVGKMRLEEMVSDRQKFANLVKENAEPDLAAMGLDIISFNVQNFVDGNDVIENLGIDNIVKIKKSAAIAKAESERDIKVAQAAADKESNDAAVEAQTEIAKKQNELAIKKSELQMEADTKKAMADAAYEIQKEEQRKTIEVTTANADIAKQEREIELKQKQVAVTEQSLEAEVKKKAEAEKYAAQQRAEAELYQRQKDAEAKQFEAQREAEAQKAQAEAMRFAREQEAAGIRAVGEAEASAIQAKGIAEAEAMEKKAEAYAKYNKAAVAEMMIKVLPDIAGKVAEPLGQIDKITIIGGGEGGSNGVDQIAGNVPVVMAKVFESMKEATGIDLADIINAESYDAKVNRNVNVSGLDSVNFVVKDDGTKVTMAKVEPQNSTKPVSTDVPESGEQG